MENFTAEIIATYNSFLSTLSPLAQTFINIFLLVLLIVIYAVFIWKFYRFIAKKNIFHFNLAKYNTAEHPVLVKFFAAILYLAEYILLLPFIIFAWFAIFTIFLIFLTESLPLESILLIAVAVISAIRMTSYIPKYGEELAKEIAKLIPFTLLAVSLLTPGFFDFARVVGHFSQISGLFGMIFNYLIFIIALEIILRFFDFLFSITGLQTPEEENPAQVENQQK